MATLAQGYMYIRLADKFHVDGNPIWGDGGLISVTMLTKGCVILLIHLMAAANLIIVPDLHQMNAGLYHHK